jgi:hypothetical protein
VVTILYCFSYDLYISNVLINLQYTNIYEYSI